MSIWYKACEKAASLIRETIPEPYRSRTFPGIIGDIKALPPWKAQSLFHRKKGLGKQYACLYLTQGIDSGRGYQACSAEAIGAVLGDKRGEIFRGNILDAGCAVGVTAGILSLKNVTGFDLFPDLLKAAQLVDSFTGMTNRYVTADMTRDWPFDRVFDTVVCGLVCHHLKEQHDVVRFFTNMNRVLLTGGYAVITLPAGSVGTVRQLEAIMNALGRFGFQPDRERSGIVLSTDNPHSLFWMFAIIVRKTSDNVSYEFIGPDFGFQQYRTPETREEKGRKARSTVAASRKVKHRMFSMIKIEEMYDRWDDKPLVFSTLSS